MNPYKKDFPIFTQQIHDKPLVFLDSAASAQKPQAVLDAISHFDAQDYANIHRGVYVLSERATQLFEAARQRVKQFINAKSTHEIIFVRGTTEAINLVAQSYGRSTLQKDDDIIVSEMEHHSNIVPWQLVAEQTGAHLKVIPVTDSGEMDLDAYEKLISPRTKIVAITHASNVLGTINPIKKMIEMAHRHDVPVLVDGAQAVPHFPVDVQALDCDFYAFSSHKLYGPTGVGVLYGKEALLDKMPPYQGGGDMIEQVRFSKTTFNKLPYKFEAGTPNISGVIGLKAAMDYVAQIGMDAIQQHEKTLLAYAVKHLSAFPEIRFIGTAPDKVGVISFVFDGIHPHDLGTILDHDGVAIRAGHHCAMPLMERFGIPACARASFGLYNSEQDVDVLVQGLQTAKRLFA